MWQIFLERSHAKSTIPARKSFSYAVWSSVLACLAMMVLFGLVQWMPAWGMGQFMVVGSMAASAVLLYAAPQVEFAQPRNVLGGHLLGALLGVTMQMSLGQYPMWAGGLAVGLTIGVMIGTRTVHPPGPATALIAVIGGESIHQLGWWYVLSPIGLSALVMVGIALVGNNLSRDTRRHYPNYWW